MDSIKGALETAAIGSRDTYKAQELQRQVGASSTTGAESIHDPHARAKAEKAAKDFEALLLKQMIGSMQQTVSKEGLLKSKDEEIYQDMLNEALADSIAKGQGIGIKDVIMRELVRRGGSI